MSESITCSHELVHIYDRHECDGCCARYTLTEPKTEITVRDFKNPTYDGPDCVCCKSKATEERERIVKLLEELLEERSGVNLKGAIALIKRGAK